MKNTIILAVMLLCLFGNTFTALSDAQVMPSEGGYSSEVNENAVIILSTNTVEEMQSARRAVEQKGCRIDSIFPPSVFIGMVPSGVLEQIKGLAAIKEVSYEKVDISLYEDYELSAQDAIRLWNERLDKTSTRDKKTLEEESSNEPFRDDVIMPEDIPSSKEEKKIIDEKYLRGWEIRKEEWQRMEREKKLKRLDMQADGAARSIEADIPKAETVGFGKTSGAGYNDTSLYMAGDVVVGVFFVKGSYGEWGSSGIDTIFTSICAALNQFITDEPNAHITFTYIKEVDEKGIPKPLPENERDYCNDIRNKYDTHWAYMIIVGNGDGRANAYCFGPSTRVYSGDWRIGYVVRHETMHIFGAMDQYEDARRSPIGKWGYLDVVNANSEYNDGKGYFEGKGECQQDIMSTSESNIIGVYSRGQIGWRDSDGDGTLDPLDTIPDTAILTKTGSNTITYAGRASDQALKNTFGDLITGYGDVTLNTIAKVEYRVNGGAWVPVEPSDGAFDSGEENFSFTTPALPNGEYAVEVRAVNSAGNIEVSYAKDKITVMGSSVTGTGGLTYKMGKDIGTKAADTAPQAFFTVTPENHHGSSAPFNVTVNAAGSRNENGGTSGLNVRWDFDANGTWDTDYSSALTVNRAFDPEHYSDRWRVKLEVKSASGKTAQTTRDVWAVTYNNPPEIIDIEIIVQRTPGAVLSAIADDPDMGTTWDRLLEYRWDFGNDGVWDTRYSTDTVIPPPPGQCPLPIVCEVRDRFSAVNRLLFLLTDTTPPTGTIEIEGTCTNSVSVKLFLSATDNVERVVYKMKISNTNPADWYAIPAVAYYTDYPWLLIAGNGTKTVYAKFIDATGNESTVVSDSIILDTRISTDINLDTSAPIVEIVAPFDADDALDSILIGASWSAYDPESGIAEYQYAIGRTEGGTDIVDWTSNGTSDCIGRIIIDPVLATGTYYFSVKAINGVELSNIGISSLTIVSNIFDIPLKKGYNFISLPMEPLDVKIESVIAPISREWKQIKSQNESCTSSSGKMTGELKEMHAGMGYSILMTEDAVLPIRGNKVNYEFPQLPYYWNWVGPTTLEAKPVTALVDTSKIAEIYTVKSGSSDITSEANKLYYPADFTVFEPGKGYKIKIKDTTAPTITHTPIKTADRDKPITFTAAVTDSASRVKEVTLMWVITPAGDAPQNLLPMTSKGNNKYEAVVNTSTGIKYCICATDNAGNSSKTLTYTITRPNKPPVAKFTAVPTSGKSPLKVTFKDMSSDSDGKIVSCRWSFGDGQSSTDKNPIHTFTNSSNYGVTLTVTDNEGASSRSPATIISVKKK